MRYEHYGKYELERAEEERQKIFKDMVALRRKRKEIISGNSRIYGEDYKIKRLYEIDKQILELEYRDSIQFNYGRIATRNIAHKEKKIKLGNANINDCIKSIDNHNIVMKNITTIDHNPLVTGDISKVYKDTEDLRVIFEVANILGRDQKRLDQMDPRVQMVIDIIRDVEKEYDKDIRKIGMDIDNLVNQMKVYTEKKKVGGRSELENYVKSLRALEAQNRMHAFSSVYEDAKKELDKVDIVERSKKRMDALPRNSKVNKVLISSNLRTAELVQFIGLAIKQLRSFRFTSSKKFYGGYTVDFASSIEKSKKAVDKLEALKEKLMEELEKSGYLKEVESMNVQIRYGEVTNTLANMYVRLEGTYGLLRKEIENNIENVLINSKIPQDMWSSIKFEAQNMARQRLDAQEFEKSSKFRTMQKKEDKEIAIAHRDMISNTEIEEIKREARREASIAFPEDYQYKSGDVHDLNDRERDEFIEKYVNDKVDKIIASRFDEKEKEATAETKALVDYTDIIGSEGLTDDMLSLAVEVLQMSGKLEGTDLSKMKSTEVKEVVDYAKKMKSYVGLTDMELAEAMVKDSKRPGEAISKEEILIQFNLNQHRGIANRLNHLFAQSKTK